MNRMLTTLRKLPRSANNWFQTMNPKLDFLIDKYKLIKVGCLLGIGINLFIQGSTVIWYTTVQGQYWLWSRWRPKSGIRNSNSTIGWRAASRRCWNWCRSCREMIYYPLYPQLNRVLDIFENYCLCIIKISRLDMKPYALTNKVARCR